MMMCQDNCPTTGPRIVMGATLLPKAAALPSRSGRRICDRARQRRIEGIRLVAKRQPSKRHSRSPWPQAKVSLSACSLLVMAGVMWAPMPRAQLLVSLVVGLAASAAGWVGRKR